MRRIPSLRKYRFYAVLLAQIQGLQYSIAYDGTGDDLDHGARQGQEDQEEEREGQQETRLRSSDQNLIESIFFPFCLLLLLLLLLLFFFCIENSLLHCFCFVW